ncbi:hexapeptide transferase [Rhodohalobacter sp. SW132]|uniref:sugar-transfer associated ATP-grasp domain-containing protein n=1 Tax=Rhodohalobacter sp. SW132 TaxID=2293433 RepID=UPI000E2498BF|nr:sugar-transfer associated ATP-grasp domain-containing protein [Rhodohalobacter sp. SW132]REL24744.1 hexapeptide transferase [Rhodohalobacter sp. SW132]
MKPLQTHTKLKPTGNKFSRVFYLGYYLKELDRIKFQKFLEFTSEKTGKGKTELLSDILSSVFKYNISILEYFQFHFYDLSDKERREWAGTGHMYEYQLRMNPKEKRKILDDKTLFYRNFGEFFVHAVADQKDLVVKPELAEKILSNPSGKIVFKAAAGKCGAEVEIRKTSEFNPKSLVEFMQDHDYDLVEEFIIQHSEINRMSPSAVNTIRMITELNEEGEVELLGCRFRISVDSHVDNMAAGNLAATIDEKTGRVTGKAVYSDITKPDVEYHPVTNVRITGFQIPYWDEIVEMVKRAAKKHPQNRSIGWDVVLTEKGPGLIEGNHDWCKLLWQLPEKKGMKSKLKLV